MMAGPQLKWPNDPGTINPRQGMNLTAKPGNDMILERERVDQQVQKAKIAKKLAELLAAKDAQR